MISMQEFNEKYTIAKVAETQTNYRILNEKTVDELLGHMVIEPKLKPLESYDIRFTYIVIQKQDKSKFRIVQAKTPDEFIEQIISDYNIQTE